MNKYKNIPMMVNGFRFDSKAEAKRYKELNLLEKAGHIENLILQPKYELQEAYILKGKKSRSVTYVADFEYCIRETGETVTEDVKGLETAVFKLKRKLFERKFKREITITK